MWVQSERPRSFKKRPMIVWRLLREVMPAVMVDSPISLNQTMLGIMRISSEPRPNSTT